MDSSDKVGVIVIICLLLGFIALFSSLTVCTYFREKTKQLAIEKAATLMELKAAQDGKECE